MLTTALSHRDCNSALLSYTLMLPLEFHRAPSIHFYLAPTFLSSDDAQSLSFTWIFFSMFPYRIQISTSLQCATLLGQILYLPCELPSFLFTGTSQNHASGQSCQAHRWALHSHLDLRGFKPEVSDLSCLLIDLWSTLWGRFSFMSWWLLRDKNRTQLFGHSESPNNGILRVIE